LHLPLQQQRQQVQTMLIFVIPISIIIIDIIMRTITHISDFRIRITIITGDHHIRTITTMPN
jgi:hypothetical protein